MGKLRKKLREKKGLMIAAAVLVLLLCIRNLFLLPWNTTSAENDDFADMKILKHFHDRYHDMDACCLIVECDEKSSEIYLEAYAEKVIRSNRIIRKIVI